MILLDTGPLAAMFNSADRFHAWTLQQLAILQPPFYTCEPVITEACFLLQRIYSGVKSVFSLLERKLILIDFDLQKEYSEVGAVMHKYEDLRIDLADACIVRMAEKLSDVTVFTLDADFLIYRKSNRQVIQTIIPEELQKIGRKKSKNKRK
jgi:predicted nucleic acid-binding protein